MRTHVVIIALLAVVGGCEQRNSACQKGAKRHRHLVCRDGDGAVVVDTYDLDRAPVQDAVAWTWWTTHETYHEVSVPPHSCVYESHDAEPGCGCGLDETAPSIEDTRLADAAVGERR